MRNHEHASVLGEQLNDIFDSLKKYPQSPVNIDVIAEASHQGLLSKEQKTTLVHLFTEGYNKAFRACFPRDSYDHLRGLYSTLEHPEKNPEKNLDREETELKILLNINKSFEDLTVKDCFTHFRRRKIEEFPYEEASARLSDVVNERLREGKLTNNSTSLKKAIGAFRLLGYLHKLKERTHYGCESEYDEMVRFGIDETSKSLITLRNSQLTENTFKNMNSTQLIRLKDPNNDWLYREHTEHEDTDSDT